jgi:hypothetical protein
MDRPAVASSWLVSPPDSKRTTPHLVPPHKDTGCWIETYPLIIAFMPSVSCPRASNAGAFAVRRPSLESLDPARLREARRLFPAHLLRGRSARGPRRRREAGRGAKLRRLVGVSPRLEGPGPRAPPRRGLPRPPQARREAVRGVAGAPDARCRRPEGGGRKGTPERGAPGQPPEEEPEVLGTLGRSASVRRVRTRHGGPHGRPEGAQGSLLLRVPQEGRGGMASACPNRNHRAGDLEGRVRGFALRLIDSGARKYRAMCVSLRA